MAKVSVLLPSRSEPFLNRTIQDVLGQATGDIECVVVLDGAPPTQPLPDDPRIVVVEHKEPMGIGQCSWDGAQAATGDFIMKLDAHCALGKGYDEILARDCGPLDLVVPSRFQLKDEGWRRGYGPIDYYYYTYPWIPESQFGWGMHGKKWLGEDGLSGGYFHREQRDKRIPLDDMQAFQGSLFFMSRLRFLELGGVDKRYWLWQESTCIGMKVWLSGGRCLIDKFMWYAHLHKGARHGRGYWINKSDVMEAAYYSADHWMNDKWDSPLRVRDMHWFVDHFWPMSGWPEDWDNPKYHEALKERLHKELKWTI